MVGREDIIGSRAEPMTIILLHGDGIKLFLLVSEVDTDTHGAEVAESSTVWIYTQWKEKETLGLFCACEALKPTPVNYFLRHSHTYPTRPNPFQIVPLPDDQAFTHMSL